VYGVVCGDDERAGRWLCSLFFRGIDGRGLTFMAGVGYTKDQHGACHDSIMEVVQYDRGVESLGL